MTLHENHEVICAEVVCHSSLAIGPAFANEVFRTLNFDLARPLDVGPNIRVRFWSDLRHIRNNESTLSSSCPTVFIVVIDDAMLESREWETWLRDLTTRAHEKADAIRLVPIVVSSQRFANAQLLGQMNFIATKLADFEEKASLKLLNGLLISILNFLAPSRLHYDVFINYVRGEGSEIRKRVVDGLSEYPYLRPFHDEGDQIPGAPYRTRFETVIKASAFLAIRTDRYSSRTEVVRELEIAKWNGRPIVELNALQGGEPRSFPYLGNCRVVRFSNDIQFALIANALLTEILRFELQRILIPAASANAGVENCINFFRTPDLHSLPKEVFSDKSRKNRQLCLYPDPPVSAPELEALQRVARSVAFLTPVQLRAARLSKSEFTESELQPLLGMTVQLSASNPSSASLNKIGLTEAHCQETIIEFARYLIAAGATIVFGGYFGSDSIGQWLLRILEVYGHSEGPQALRMKAVFPFPIGLKLRSEQKELLSRLLHYRVIPPPDDICLETQAGQGLPSDPSSFESKLVWTRCLTVARKQIAKDVDAVVVIGGKETGYMGRYAGLVEESLFAIRERKALFAVGCLGGCAQSIYSTLMGLEPELPCDAFNESIQKKDAGRFWSQFNRRFPSGSLDRIDYKRLNAEFQGRGRRIKSLKNTLLTQQELDQLGTSHNLSECVSLVLKGLSELNHKKKMNSS